VPSRAWETGVRGAQCPSEADPDERLQTGQLAISAAKRPRPVATPIRPAHPPLYERVRRLRPHIPYEVATARGARMDAASEDTVGPCARSRRNKS
jgi:hypothetical protein